MFYNIWETPIKYNKTYPKTMLTIPVTTPIFAMSF